MNTDDEDGRRRGGEKFLPKMAGSGHRQQEVVVTLHNGASSETAAAVGVDSGVTSSKVIPITSASRSSPIVGSEFPVFQPTLDHSYVYSNKPFVCYANSTAIPPQRNHDFYDEDSDLADNVSIYKSVEEPSDKQILEEQIHHRRDILQNECAKYGSLTQSDQNILASNKNVLKRIELHRRDAQVGSAVVDSCSVSTTINPLERSEEEELPSKLSVAPLGSVQNPIQIIQQGNAFRSTQVLSKEQLQQIAQVLQQQQLSKAVQNGGKSMLYDETTNTRIIYRVIYPSEVDKKNSVSGDSSATAGPNRGKGRPRKAWPSSSSSSSSSKRVVDEEKTRAMLSKEEREEKKKHRPRTRSGRISKPPSYMVKDYKRIHHLDFNEEPYDDSDGGYSDYHVSDEDNGSNKKNSQDGTSSSKQRNYRCLSCSKAYIGKGGLSRHYRLNPSHRCGQEGEDASTQDENSNSSAVSVLSSSRLAGRSGAISNLPAISQTIPPSSARQQSLRTATSVLDFVSSRRRNKLREVLKNFSDRELLDVALPRLSHLISPWNLMLLKSRDSSSKQLIITELLRHFETVLAETQETVKSMLSSAVSVNESGKKLVHVTSDSVAKALSINVGTYFIRDAKVCHTNDLPSSKRSIQSMNSEKSVLMSPEDMVNLQIKRRKIDAMPSSIMAGNTVGSDLPVKILNDCQETDNMASLRLSSIAYDDGTVLPEQVSSQLLKAIQENPVNNLSDFCTQVSFDCNGINVPTVSGQKNVLTGGHSTTVTPSSLSSGCLSAIDSSEVLQNHAYISAGNMQTLENVQLQEVPLFDSALQTFQSTDFTSTGSLKIADNGSNRQDSMMTDSERALLVLNSVRESSSNQLHDASSQRDQADVYSTVDYNITQPAVSIFNASIMEGGTLQVVSQLTNCSQKPYMSSQMTGDGLNSSDVHHHALESTTPCSTKVIASCSEPLVVSKNPTESYSSVNMGSLDVETSAIMDSSAVIRHLVLPDGRVVGSWSPPENQSDILYEEQFVNEQLLPASDLILVQNQDGSYQVPNEQIVTPEALQALMSAGQILINQEKGEKLSLI